MKTPKLKPLDIRGKAQQNWPVDKRGNYLLKILCAGHYIYYAGQFRTGAGGLRFLVDGGSLDLSLIRGIWRIL